MGESVLKLESVVTDCVDPQRLADFYGALLGTEVSRRVPGFIWLAPAGDAATSLAFQRVPDPTPGKNRLHFDLSTPDLSTARDRIEQLGGSFVETHQIGGFSWSTFADPEGNVFDLVGE
jgi:predicted enzyme related to lactoylglutathione lyase